MVLRLATRSPRELPRISLLAFALACSFAVGCSSGDSTSTDNGTGGTKADASSDGAAGSSAGNGGNPDSGPKPDSSIDSSAGKGGSGGVTDGGHDVSVEADSSDSSDSSSHDAADASDATSCKTDTDCTASSLGPNCNIATGLCAGCNPADATTCAIGSWCDPAKWECLAGCDSNDDCGGANDGGAAVTCDTASHQCVGCLKDDQCPLGQLCNAGTCTAGCSAQHGCGNGEKCCSSVCVATSSDANNCGACGKVCALPNAQQSCLGGSCVIGGCSTGFENCDQVLSNGCEADTAGGGGCACTPNLDVDCYDGPPATLDVGVCKGGKKTCNALGTSFGPCVGQILPGAESCYTAVDDDCNGQTNEAGKGCVCLPNDTANCYTGSTDTRNEGACKDGTWKCNSSGTGWGTCSGQVLPSPETCLTPVDDNCDGQVNEAGGAGCACSPKSQAPCYNGPPGTENVGPCKAGMQTCNDLGTGYGACVGDVSPTDDICTDNVDNDCNGIINDGISSTAPGCICFPLAVSSCYTGTPGTEKIGVCKTGIATCTSGGNAWGTCTGQVIPTSDTCADLLDNDCNGVINDGFSSGGASCTCLPGTQQECYEGAAGTKGVGVCVAGMATCGGTGTAWGPCIGQIIPDLDSCLDQLDNDCNGTLNDGPPSAPGCACITGSFKCEGNSQKVCDASGAWGPLTSCGTKTCTANLGCVTCVPGVNSCVGSVAHKCRADGSGYDDFECDALMGSSCSAGACTGVCAPDLLQKSYIGCDYYPTVTMNSLLTNASAHFAVAVSNTSTATATVTITQGAATISTVIVAPGAVQVVNLPWTALKNSATTSMLASGAYRLRSTQPVTVYQFNPLEYSAGGAFTYTNDASLLLPVNAWKNDYMVAARATWANAYPGYYAVVASQNGTTVTIKPSATGNSVVAGAGVAANGAGTFTINRGDVVQVASASNTVADVTGTMVSADKPIQVFGGHNCTDIPYNVVACDHIEESMFPIATLGKEYIVTAPSLPTLAQPKTNMVRIIAVETGTTTLSYEPASAWTTTIAGQGQFIEIDTPLSFRITADKKILVAQYMEGQAVGGNSGDPAMALAVASAQFRPDYLFHAPTNYETNYVNILAPAGATVQVDGIAVPSFAAIGTTGFGVARVVLPAGANAGTHKLTASAPVGITVYGYGQWTSYWYPGGLNLSDL